MNTTVDYPVAGYSNDHCGSNVNNLLLNDVYTDSDLALRVCLSIGMSHVTILSAIQVHQFFVMFQGIMNNPVV
jgi:hypothetical protein